MFTFAMLAILLLAPVQMNAAAGHDPADVQFTVSTEVGLLIGRLEEIKDTDVSSLSGTERRELRKETRDIQKQLHALSGSGIYISVGAAILIVLLLILLL